MLPLQLSPSIDKEKNPFSLTNNKPPSIMKKRFREQNQEEEEEEEESMVSNKKKKKDSKLCLPNLNSFIELNLDTPLPLEWQRCLNIRSGEIHFYNTMTHMRTVKDPRLIGTTPPPALDLELNLMFDPSEINGCDEHDDHNSRGDEKEMVATVCARCHLLVMMPRASPSCPNCRFEHPPATENKLKSRLLSCRGLRG